MSDEKIRKFRALIDICNPYFGNTYTVKKGEALTVFQEYPACFNSKERMSQCGTLWWYEFCDFEEVFEDEKPKEIKFMALQDIVHDLYLSDRVFKGDILTYSTVAGDDLLFKEKSGRYNKSCFKEITDERQPHPSELLKECREYELAEAKDINKISIDDLIKLRSAFSLDEIITLIEKGIV